MIGDKQKGVRPNVPRRFPIAAADGGVEWFELEQLKQLRAVIGRMTPAVRQLLAAVTGELDEQLRIAGQEEEL